MTRKRPVPNMTCHVFGGTLNLAQSMYLAQLCYLSSCMHCAVLPGEESADKPGSKLYKPTSKLLDKKAASSVPSLLKPKEEEKPERPVCSCHYMFNELSRICISAIL